MEREMGGGQMRIEKFHENKVNIENKNLKASKNSLAKKNIKKEQKTSRVLENLKNNNIKENKVVQSEVPKYFSKKYKNDLSNTIKVGVMLPLTGERQDVGNLILNAIEMAIFQTDDNKLELIIKDTEANPEKAKNVFFELIDEGVSIVIGPLFSKSLAAIQSSGQASGVNIFALTIDAG